MVEGCLPDVFQCWPVLEGGDLEVPFAILDIQTFTQLTVLKPSLPSNLPIRSTLEDLCL